MANIIQKNIISKKVYKLLNNYQQRFSALNGIKTIQDSRIFNYQRMSKMRYLSPIYLYNMLQDFRHLLIFDLRNPNAFQQTYIRDSFNVNEQTPKQKIFEVIYRAQLKAGQKEMKYKQLKKIRRYFFISENKIPEDDKKLTQILGYLQKCKTSQDKIYALDGGMSVFSNKYPFMCLTKEKLQQIALKKTQNKQQQADKILLYPYSKFPSQIILDKLYLGNVYSSNSEKQLQDLQITQLIDFIAYNEDEKVPEFKTKQGSKYNYLNLPFSNDVAANIDFDLINEQLDKCIQKGRTLFYCKDGEVISPAFVISYLMYKCKLDVNMATLKVCQAISRVEICKWIYTQLLIYKPKK